MPLLYEINTRCWLRELSRNAGSPVTLANVSQSHFEQWQSWGVTHIWLMGVWTSGPQSRAQAQDNAELQRVYSEVLPGWRPDDIAGSPYAIADYHVPAELGGEAGLKSFRSELHRRGMNLVLDFVPNHVGLDHPWLKERPELFVQGETQRPGTFRSALSGARWIAHGKDPYFPAWTDTAQIDYRRPETRTEMVRLLKTIADRCDGVRCDMAMLVLNDVFANTWREFPCASVPGHEPSQEFWSMAIPAIKALHPDFIFLAEAYWGLEGRLQQLGFDYTYDKTLYDRIVSREWMGVGDHLFGLPGGVLRAGAHFLENHDEPRIASCLTAKEEQAAALLIMGLPGLSFLHEGQLSGARKRVPVQLIRRPAETTDAAIFGFYDSVLKVLAKSAATKGTHTLLRARAAWDKNPTAQNISLIQWQSNPGEFYLVVVNLAPHRSQCYAPLSVPGLAEHDWKMEDMLGSEKYVRPGKELAGKGLYLDEQEFAAQLFHFTPSPGP